MVQITDITIRTITKSLGSDKKVVVPARVETSKDDDIVVFERINPTISVGDNRCFGQQSYYLHSDGENESDWSFGYNYYSFTDFLGIVVDVSLFSIQVCFFADTYP